MPDGRFLSKSIAYSAQLASVSFEADYLFARMVPFQDREGRTPGAPNAVKGMCCPLRDEMTPLVIERCLGELRDAGLILWYRVGPAMYAEFPGFANHQKGARLDREAASKIPAPGAPNAELIRSPAAKSRSRSGPTPAKVRVSKGKGSKVKSRKVKGREEAPNAGASAVGEPKPAAEQKPPKPKRTTWITPFADVWEDLYGGRMPIEPNLRPLKEAVEKLGPEESLRRWEIYLAQTQAKYASASRFASTLDEWAAPGKPANGKPGLTSSRVETTPASLTRATELLQIGRTYDLLSYDGNKAAYTAHKQRAASDALAGPTFDADLIASRIWEGIDGLSESVAVKEIARRLVIASNGAHAEAKSA